MKKASYHLSVKNVAKRREALLSLQGNNSPLAFSKICQAIKKDPSSIIRHEAAFLLATTKKKKAIKPLIEAIKTDKSELVLHEAIEALGDLGIYNKSVGSLLQKYSKNSNPLVSESAEIALEMLKMK